MKKSAKTILKISFAVVLVIVGLFALGFILPVAGFIYSYDQRMSAGKKYMDSLSEKDFQTWTARTQKYLSEFDPKAYIIDAKPVPEELKQLKILRIDEDSNWVRYVWAGGFDHTLLLVQKMEDGSFQFTARYNDQSNRVIWLKTNLAGHYHSQTNLIFHLTQ